ncbi:MAG: HesA/MoeB/ThiF family protein [Deltaproteobacteria bacterium]|nr:HesA/MoeB/ThiF family protein [Deltaproteobacteria bacterium]
MKSIFNFSNTRYNRQLEMPEWGMKRQQLLEKAKVAVIGAGGVKSSLLYALTSAGIGHLRVIDFDKVELSNLNRQFLYTTDDIGKFKAEVSVSKLQKLNPDISIDPLVEKVTENNISALLCNYDFIVEGGDSPAGRNLINEYCLSVAKPFVHASAQFNYGYVFTVVPKLKTACYACFYPNDIQRKESTGAVPVNVLSVQIAGTLGATEVLKYFIGYEDNLIINRKLTFSSLFLSENFSTIKQSRRHHCPICSRYY